jgi:glycosyltransferase involved in cell wall biosynthesis
MRVLLITSAAIPHVGGLSTHFELLRKRLAAASMLVGCITAAQARRTPASRLLELMRHPGDAEGRRARAVDVMVERLAVAVAGAMARADVDVLHCHDPLAASAALLAAAESGVPTPVVQTVHGPLSREVLSDGTRRDGVYVERIRGHERRAYRGCAHLLPVDTGQAEILWEDFQVEGRRCTVVPNSVDAVALRRMACRSTPHLATPYFVVPRRLVRKNGVAVAIRAIARLPQAGAQLLIAGDGPLRRELEALAASLGAGGRVRFLGDVEHARLLPLMRASVGVVVPSIPAGGVVEATSLSALEGLAVGVPVVASEIGGLAEMLTHGQTGFLFPAGDCGALAALLERVQSMPETERRCVAEAGTALVDSRFGVEAWFSKIFGVYEEAAYERVGLG